VAAIEKSRRMPLQDKHLHLNSIADLLRTRRTEDVSLFDVVALAEITASSLQTFFETMDVAIYRELREIDEYIQGMKIEIGALGVNEIREKRIPAAGEELGAIIKATENATNTIMGCAEAVMSADTNDVEAFKGLVAENMLVIFEACSFQDITGQRIAKVVETLEHIEKRVARFAAAVHAKDLGGYLSEVEQTRAERCKRLLLNGPARDGEGIGQTEVDRLLG
jgi:chemotaxis protein CheZ